MKNWKIILAFAIAMALFVIFGIGVLKVYGQDKCSAQYPEGTEVILTATPCPGYSFAGWSGDCVTCGKSRSCKVVMTAERTCKANFLPMPNNPRMLPPTNLQIGCNDVRAWR